ncbi:hypothetical protein [Micromonospora sp. NPDC047074]|uniref:hypothetical protein n=1 Tax=Micromonospora sp. NPDC047074 TaxID=3154339 RepID=UPI00340EDF29
MALLFGVAVGAGVLGVALSGDPATAADRAGLAGTGLGGVTEASGPPGSRPAPALTGDGTAVVGPARSAPRTGRRDRPGARTGLVTPVGDLVTELGRRMTPASRDRDRPRDDERHRPPATATPTAPVTAAPGAAVPDDGTPPPVRRLAPSSRAPAAPAGTSLVPRLAAMASSLARPATSAGAALVPRAAGTVSSVVTPVVRAVLSATDSVVSRVIGLPCVIAPAPVVPADPSSPPAGGPGLSPPAAQRPVASTSVQSPSAANAPAPAAGTWFPIAPAPGAESDRRPGRGGGDAAASAPGPTGLPARPVLPGEDGVAATTDGGAPAVAGPSTDTDHPGGVDDGSPPAPPARGDRFFGVTARPG